MGMLKLRFDWYINGTFTLVNFLFSRVALTSFHEMNTSKLPDNELKTLAANSKYGRGRPKLLVKLCINENSFVEVSLERVTCWSVFC